MRGPQWKYLSFPAEPRDTGPSGVKVTALEVKSASLRGDAFFEEWSSDGRQPLLYDHERTIPTPTPEEIASIRRGVGVKGQHANAVRAGLTQNG